MLFKVSKQSKTNNYEKNLAQCAQHAIQEAVYASQCVLELELDGTIIAANENFLSMIGYSMEKIEGRNHSVLIPSSHANTLEHRKLWDNLGRGEHASGEHIYAGGNGAKIWVRGTFCPILDADGKLLKIVLFAVDVTDLKRTSEEMQGQFVALNKSLAVIEFAMDGTIVDANDNFLSVMGYSLADIRGKHHSVFVDKQSAASSEYKEFWRTLNRGEFDAGEYKRLGRGGKEVWIQASYNPILDENGTPVKVIKFASDITDQRVLQEKTIKALGEVKDVMMKMANGDLSPRVVGSYKCELDQLSVAVNSCAEKISRIVVQIKNGADALSLGAREIAQGSADLSARTEQQASSLEETASSMEQMTSTVKQNADNAQQANRIAVEAREQAEKGGRVVGDAVRAMGEINQASKKIADIIGVIDEIAFQTNLLALNASVEAARAGEQGRGFAVVASEVRNLAGRSATAAKEIKELIQDSVGKVDEGSRLVGESGNTLDAIVSGVQKVTDIVAEIAAASNEQSAGIEEVNKAVMQMDETTQQNAALVEQAAAASADVGDQTRQLRDVVSFFSVDDQGAADCDGAEYGLSAPVQDRRAAERPWGEKQTERAKRPATANPVAQTVPSRSDDDWQEF